MYNSVNTLKIIELYTLKGQIIWYVNDISVKLLKIIEKQSGYVTQKITRLKRKNMITSIEEKAFNEILQSFVTITSENHKLKGICII